MKKIKLKNINEILIVTTEFSQIAQVGGLGDVTQALSYNITKLTNIKVNVLIPYYGVIKTKNTLKKELDFKFNIKNQEFKFCLYKLNINRNLNIYLLKNDELFFSRKGIYNENSLEYPDNEIRFFALNKATLELIYLKFFNPQIIHIHDWHVGLIPFLLKNNEKYQHLNIKTVLTIHNAHYQGFLPNQDLIQSENIKLQTTSIIKSIEDLNHLNWLKLAIIFADKINTVSLSYMKELLLIKQIGLYDLLLARIKDFYGIINGCDYENWDPKKDKFIKYKYDDTTFLYKKEKNKQILTKELKLVNPNDYPLISIISRLTHQKGLDLIIDAWEEIINKNINIIILGQGDKNLEAFFINEAKKYPNKVFTFIGFSERLAHQIHAASDIFLMPSRYEPCGLTQMYALKYGNIPIAHAVGGLKDTIIDFNKDESNGCGFLFYEFNKEAFIKTFNEALILYQNKSLWNKIIKNALKQNFDYINTTKKYIALYSLAYLNNDQ